MSSIKKDKVTVKQAVLPIRALFHHLRMFFLLVLAVAVLVVSRFDNATVRTARATVLEVVTPVLSALFTPIESYHALKENLHQVVAVHKENAKLRQETARLERIQGVAVELEAENKRLRELLHFAPAATTSFVTAKIVGATGGPYTRSAMINAGSGEGIHVGQVVYNREGIVGRVTDTGFHSARVLLLTDINSRIPVMGDASHEHAILAGNNTGYAEMQHLPADSGIAVGEKIVTADDGQFFPAGIPVGVVVGVTEEAVQVRPFVDWGKLEYVTVAEAVQSAVPVPVPAAETSAATPAAPVAPAAVVAPAKAAPVVKAAPVKVVPVAPAAKVSAPSPTINPPAPQH